jgi:hypothetical protein
MDVNEFLIFGESGGSQAVNLQTVQNIKKALETGYAYGSTDQTGYGAVRLESMDDVLKIVTAKEEHIRFWNAVTKSKANSTVEEFASIQELPEASGFGEYGMPNDSDGELKREVEFMRLTGITGKVSKLAQSVRNIQDPYAIEYRIKTIALLSKLNHLSVWGDTEKDPTAPNGIMKQALGRMSYPDQNVINLKGKPLTPEVLEMAGQIIQDNKGNPTNLQTWTSPGIYNYYVKQLMADKRYVVSAGMQDIYATAKNFTVGTAKGKIETDIFFNFRDQREINSLWPHMNKAKTDFAVSHEKAPNTYSVAVSQAVLTAAEKAAGKVGMTTGSYDYAIVAVNQYGAGKAVETTVDVNSDNKVVFTITDSSSNTATKYEIYRKKTEGTGKRDYRYIRSFKTTDTVVDDGYYIPGCGTCVVIDWDMQQVFAIKELVGMSKWPLPPFGWFDYWMQFIVWSPMVYNGNRIVVLDNVGGATELRASGLAA